MTTSEKTKGILTTYLSLPPAERNIVLDKLIKPRILEHSNPPEAALLSRHIRLTLVIGDLYDELGHYLSPDNQDSAEYFRDGCDRTKAKIDRAHALIRENARRAQTLLGEPQDTAPGTFLERLRDRAAQTRNKPTPLYIPELEID